MTFGLACLRTQPIDKGRSPNQEFYISLQQSITLYLRCVSCKSKLLTELQKWSSWKFYQCFFDSAALRITCFRNIKLASFSINKCRQMNSCFCRLIYNHPLKPKNFVHHSQHAVHVDANCQMFTSALTSGHYDLASVCSNQGRLEWRILIACLAEMCRLLLPCFGKKK